MTTLTLVGEVLRQEAVGSLEMGHGGFVEDVHIEQQEVGVGSSVEVPA